MWNCRCAGSPGMWRRATWPTSPSGSAPMALPDPSERCAPPPPSASTSILSSLPPPSHSGNKLCLFIPHTSQLWPPTSLLWNDHLLPFLTAGDMHIIITMKNEQNSTIFMGKKIINEIQSKMMVITLTPRWWFYSTLWANDSPCLEIWITREQF